MGFGTLPARAKVAATAVHVLTASGALIGLIALHFAARQQWEAAFAWLGAALVIDGVDGPLARRWNVEAALPRFSGTRLDLVIDYFNYCAVPAFILWQGGLMPPALAGLAGALAALTSLFHFADRKSKTEDGYFVGFPAVWNVVAFYLFALGLSGVPAFLVVAALAAATFLPLTWAHPLRSAHLRPATYAVIAAWAVAAVAALAHGFPGPLWTRAVLAGAALYFIALGLWRSAKTPPAR